MRSQVGPEDGGRQISERRSGCRSRKAPSQQEIERKPVLSSCQYWELGIKVLAGWHKCERANCRL